MKKKLLPLVSAIVLLAILLGAAEEVAKYCPQVSMKASSKCIKSNDDDQFQECVFPLEAWISPLKIEIFSPLSAKETEYYQKNTWDSSKTLEQNRRALVRNFMKTCIDPVEDFLSADGGVILKLASKVDGWFIKSANIEEVRKQDLEEIFYLMTDSPLFCQLLRSLLTKYNTLPYRPQRAVLLFTKGTANLTSYSALHHVINVRTLDQTILSAIDCTRHKILFGGTIFHEMLHWLHQICDLKENRTRCMSTSCIQRRLGEYLPFYRETENLKKIAKYFSNDEEYYTMYGLKEHEGSLVWYPLCEASYTLEQYQYVRSCHVSFEGHLSEEHSFLKHFRDSSFLKFLLSYPFPSFGEGDFACLDSSH
ncbi:MAG: hypothetical protein LBG20_03960 [Holosporaceae bacterium]|jgi:hypothetical protein|nr:hypothetical protein [Holosporaceae bacterium]